MPKFKYVATDPTGVKVSGVMSAASAVRVRNELSSREFRNVQVKERKRLSQIEITTKKLKPVDLMNFSRQIAAFLRAGIPILDALHALAEEASNPQLKDVLVDISDALRSGDTLSNAMAVHSEIFPSYYIGILRSAELTGNLDSVLAQLASYIERDLEAKRAVKSALTYPAVIMVMAAVTVLVLVAYVLPKFEDFFEDFDAELPFATRMLLSTSRFIEDTWVFLVLGAVVRRPRALPVPPQRIGTDVARSNAPAPARHRRGRALRGHRTVLPHSRLDAARRRARSRRAAVGDGGDEQSRLPARARRRRAPKSSAVRGCRSRSPTTGLFPGAAGQMLRVGEESGTLDQQLELAADYYQGELDFRLKRLTALFEPAVIVIMGLIVGFVADRARVRHVRHLQPGEHQVSGPRRARGERGETLVELMVTIAIMGIAFVAILTGVAIAISASGSHRQEATAEGVVRSFAERISDPKDTPYVDCASAGDVSESEWLRAAVRGLERDRHVGRVPPAGGAAAGATAAVVRPDLGAQQITLQVSSPSGRNAATETLVIVKRAR